MRHSDNHANDPNIVEHVITAMESMKGELLEGMKEQTVILKRSMMKKTKRTVQKIKLLRDELEILKKDRLQWVEYKQ